MQAFCEVGVPEAAENLWGDEDMYFVGEVCFKERCYYLRAAFDEELRYFQFGELVEEGFQIQLIGVGRYGKNMSAFLPELFGEFSFLFYGFLGSCQVEREFF